MLLLLTAAGAGAFYYLIIYPAQSAVNEFAIDVADTFRDRFQFTPQITIDKRVVVESSTPILEIALLERKARHRFQAKDRSIWGTKILYLQGEYTAKAGYDLKDETYSIAIESGDSTIVRLRLPDPEILSFETDSIAVLRDEDGWWNEVTAEERQVAIGHMKREARLRVIEQGILKEVETAVEEELLNMITKSDIQNKVVLIWEDNGTIKNNTGIR